MKDILSRLRAALTPQAVLLLIAALLLVWFTVSGQEKGMLPLEKRLQRTLCHVSGAGHVEVTIRTRDIPSGGTGALGTPSTEAVPCGAVIVAQGADDPLVSMELQQAACALLGLPASSVSVIKGGGRTK